MARIPAEFLNVDVDLRSRTHLSGLIEALSLSLVVTHVGRDGRNHWVRLCFVNPKDPSRAIRRFARLFAKLPKALQRAWHDAVSREFDIGIQAGDKPQATEWVLDADAIKEAGRLGARVRITVYSPRRRDH